MIAYVFWHLPRAQVDLREYETKLAAFHDRLLTSRPVGFLGSFSFHLQRVPWLGGSHGYEDWYLLKESAALDTLESGSTVGAVGLAHAQIATLTQTGTAGLFACASSEPDGLLAASAVWFSKPSGMTYDTLRDRLPEAGPRLWQRRLTLGPTPEFCLLNAGPDYLPYGWPSELVTRRPV